LQGQWPPHPPVSWVLPALVWCQQPPGRPQANDAWASRVRCARPMMVLTQSGMTRPDR
jgi:hypothetical protein